MRIATFSLGPLETNCYIIDNGAAAVAVDPGGEITPVLHYLKEHGLGLSHILCTHLHCDHVYGVAALCRATGATTLGSPLDAPLLHSEFGQGGLMGLPRVEEYSFTPLDPGPLALLESTCQVLATPGHTPGGLSFYFPKAKAVFSGDALFFRSVGRTDFPGGDADTLANAIRTQLFTLPGDTCVYPGHGRPSSVDDEKRNNPFVSDFAA